MSDTATLRRKLKIQSGVVKRLNKEQILYTKESEDQKTKLDKFIAGNAEDWDIKNATRMLEESKKMIEDSAERLGKAVQILRALVVEARQNSVLSGDEDLLKAEEEMQLATL